MVLSGMNEISQVEDNLRTFRQDWPLTEEERKVLMDSQVEDNLRTFRQDWPLTEEERKVLMDIAENLKKGVPCTACRYCCDGCPIGLNIPYLLECYNDYKFAQTMTPSMRIDALEDEIGR